MIEEEGKRVQAPDHRYAEGLLYDHFKHLISLSVLTIGGILILVQMDESNEIKPFGLWFTLGLVGFAGVAAFEVTSEIVRANYTGTPLKKRFEIMRRIAPISYALGTGGALTMFIHVLSRS